MRRGAVGPILSVRKRRLDETGVGERQRRAYARDMRPLAVVALVLSLAGAALCAGVAIHEWQYHEDHPFATGVSGVLTVFAIGAMLGYLAVATLALALGRER
jgi:hypothetical protein